MEFLNIIDNAIYAMNEELAIAPDIFKDRYTKIIQRLNILKKSYTMNTLNKKRIYLDIVKLLDINDPEKVQDIVSSVNHYYQEKIYMDE